MTHTVSPVTVTGVPSVSVISVKASVHVFSCLRAWLVMLYVRARGLEGHASFSHKADEAQRFCGLVAAATGHRPPVAIAIASVSTQ